ncbi:MAG: response regulator, partial [Desulfobacterales bacterium]|nr:response regulator [Desulfobacterales bacterium]
GTIQVIARDLSDRKRREEEKLKFEKLESIGLLSGGIAHDFNNLLSVILGNITLAQNDSDPGSRGWSFLKAAEEACMRSKNLIRQLITFSRGGAPVKETCPIGHLIENTVTAVAGQAISKGGVEIATDLWSVECDPEQVEHALSNIIKNALESIPSGGALKIKAANYLTDDSRDNQDKDPGNGKYVRITVSDQGVGIPEENRLKVFDPYFSTKQRGDKKGMGLGLTTANSIIEKHDGYIHIESAVNSGTSMHIYLPAASPILSDVPAFKPPPKPVGNVPAGKSILMMDDEKMILELGRIMLGRLGYKAEFAEDGERALELFKKAIALDKPHDAVILDLTIKHGISGILTLKKMLGIAPGTRAIVSSGYSEDPVMTAPQSHGFQASLPKPYTSVELEKVLTEVLGHEK